jgi:inorganic pyrophosphatase
MHFLAEIRHFFEVYKTLEQKETEIIGWQDAASAEETIRDAQQRYHGRGSRGR